MERGNQQGGLGIIQWWGLSPAIDLTTKLINPCEEINVLLCGAGDIRHILETVGRLKRQKVVKKVNFHVWEPQTELYARQCIMLLAMTEPNCAFTVQSKKGYPYCDFFFVFYTQFLNGNMENLTKG